MCSVLQSPIPTAPNLRAVSASCGVSAFVRTFSLEYLSAKFINSVKSASSSASLVATAPK